MGGGRGEFLPLIFLTYKCKHQFTPLHFFMFSQSDQLTLVLVTWQLSSGESLRIQLVRVLKTHQRLGCTRCILFIREVLSVCGHVGNEPWRGRREMSGCF